MFRVAGLRARSGCRFVSKHAVRQVDWDRPRRPILGLLGQLASQPAFRRSAEELQCRDMGAMLSYLIARLHVCFGDLADQKQTFRIPPTSGHQMTSARYLKGDIRLCPIRPSGNGGNFGLVPTITSEVRTSKCGEWPMHNTFGQMQAGSAPFKSTARLMGSNVGLIAGQLLIALVGGRWISQLSCRNSPSAVVSTAMRRISSVQARSTPSVTLAGRGTRRSTS